MLTKISKHEGSGGEDKWSNIHVDSRVRTDIDVVSMKSNECNTTKSFFDALFVAAVAETPKGDFDQSQKKVSPPIKHPVKDVVSLVALSSGQVPGIRIVRNMMHLRVMFLVKIEWQTNHWTKNPINISLDKLIFRLPNVYVSRIMDK
jgi:hypothetical protein